MEERSLFQAQLGGVIFSGMISVVVTRITIWLQHLTAPAWWLLGESFIAGVIAMTASLFLMHSIGVGYGSRGESVPKPLQSTISLGSWLLVIFSGIMIIHHPFWIPQ